VKTQTGMKKFPNHFGCWIAEDAPPLYHATEALRHVAKRRVPTTLQNSFSLTFPDKMNNFP